MKIVQINTFSYKATGTIMMNIHHYLLTKGIDSYVIWGRGREPENDHEYKIQSKIGFYTDAFLSRMTDKAGSFSKGATKRLINILEKIKPDIIQLHNIHGYYLNLTMLWEYIKKKQIHIVWTFHDCWPFTGHCAYYSAIGCDKWTNKCGKCPQTHTYPSSWFIDNSLSNFFQKKELFLYDKLTIVAPCKWMKSQVERSFFCNTPCHVIYNGIDTSIFKPTFSNFRKEYHLEDKKIILGVASEWTKRKGIDFFLHLSCVIEKRKDFVIVLVGLSKKQIKLLPSNIIGINRIADPRKLAELYSTSDFLFNPTLEDNFPTVNLEAQACGTAVYTFPTGGCKEQKAVNNKFYVIDYTADFERIFCEETKKQLNTDFSFDAMFSKEKMIDQYFQLFMSLV